MLSAVAGEDVDDADADVDAAAGPPPFLLLLLLLLFCKPLATMDGGGGGGGCYSDAVPFSFIIHTNTFIFTTTITTTTTPTTAATAPLVPLQKERGKEEKGGNRMPRTKYRTRGGV